MDVKISKYRDVSILTLLLCVFVNFFSAVRGQEIRFNHITPDQGVGFGDLWSINEDHEGFMWFGTEDGLIKYNGYNLKLYKNNPSDSSSLSANFVMTMLEDRFDQIWIGTFGGGLNLYNRNQDNFYRYVPEQRNLSVVHRNRVKTLLESKDGNIWLGTEGGGIYKFDPDPARRSQMTFEKFEHPKLNKSDMGLQRIRSIAEDEEGKIYIGTLSGLVILSKDRKDLQILRKGDKYPNKLSSNSLLKIFVDSRERIWIGTLDAGLDLYIPSQNEVINYSASIQEYTLNHPEIETITEDKDGIIWIGTDNGLSKLDKSMEFIPPNQITNFGMNL